MRNIELASLRVSVQTAQPSTTPKTKNTSKLLPPTSIDLRRRSAADFDRRRNHRAIDHRRRRTKGPLKTSDATTFSDIRSIPHSIAGISSSISEAGSVRGVASSGFGPAAVRWGADCWRVLILSRRTSGSSSIGANPSSSSGSVGLGGSTESVMFGDESSRSLASRSRWAWGAVRWPCWTSTAAIISAVTGVGALATWSRNSETALGARSSPFSNRSRNRWVEIILPRS